MGLLDRDIHTCSALVIDGNPTSRSILVAQLRDFGLGTVAQCGRVADARVQLELKRFDVVLCEQHFHGTDLSGQQLLDDLRRHQLLPLSTVFVMITSEASYAKVTEAAESALDSYLLKPHTATALGERILHARHRKRVLKDIFEAVDDGRFDDAAALCVQRFRARAEFWLFAARIGTEVLLSLGRHAEAKELYEAVLQAQAVPWAKLGIARAQVAGNDVQRAVRSLETLIAEQPSYVDAYDVMGRLQLEQGDFAAAMSVYRQAAALTPGSIGRLQKLGMLAFHAGDPQEAARALERAALLGISSKMFDFQTLVLLAFARYRQQDTKGLQRCIDNLAHAVSRAPGSDRLQRFAKVAEALNAMLHRHPDDAAAIAGELAAAIGDEGFDLEAACNLLTLVAHLKAAGVGLDRADEWVDAVGLRHCTSKAFTDLLARTAAAHEPFAERIRQCQLRVTHIAEQAMAHSLAGKPGAAVRGLIEQGRRTLNGKLLDNARLVLQRHHERIPDAAALLAEADQLRQRFCSGPTKLSLGDGARAAGGLALRTSAPLPAATADSTPA